MSHAKMGLWEMDFVAQTIKWDEGIRQLYEVVEPVYSCPMANWYDKVLSADRDRLRQEIENSPDDVNHIDSLFGYEMIDGKVKYIRTNAIKIRDATNKTIGLLGLNWDITDQFRLQADLNKTRIFLEKVVDAIPDPLFIKDKNLNYIFANSAFESLIGLEKKDFIGKVDSDFLEEDMSASCYQLDIAALAKQTIIEKEEAIRNFGTDSVRQILTKKIAIKIENEDPVLIGLIRDITEIKNIQNSMIAQSKMASLGEMAAEIAHEINNPLMIVQAKAQMLLEKLSCSTKPLDQSRLEKDLQAIENNSLRIDKIIKSLKSVSRQSGQDPLEQVSILKLVDEAYEIAKERFQGHQIKFTIQIDKDVDYMSMVKARGSEIVQVLLNLLNNSFDAIVNQKNGWVKIGVSALEAGFRIDVIDSGPKLSEDIIARMMQPFFTTKAKGYGTGLGLSVSKQIISNHQGEFYFDEKAPMTQFSFYLKRSVPKTDSPSIDLSI
jgi:PAS domain S-box-containing protein